MRASLQQRFSAWARARQTRHEGTVTLTQRSVYIIPTRRGFAFAGALVVMLLGDINYVLGLGYVLTFLLASMGLMSMLHAVRNMLRLEIRAGRTEPVFTGDMAEFRFHLHNPRPLARHGLHLRDEHGHHTEFDLPANQTLEVGLPVPATQRGWLATGRLTLYTEFPLGLFYAWSYIYFDTRVPK